MWTQLMQPAAETSFDAASALTVGRREHQEDAVIADFPIGSDTGVIVLSDGMGGHAAGDVASKIVMTEVFCELKFQSGDPLALGENTREVLRDALHGANECLAAHIEGNPRVRGMGATLLAAVFQDGRLNWISVGDSPLYLYRDGMLRQLNEDHSMAPQIDQMAACGMMDHDAAREHPDRNALISVLAGSEVAKIDSPEDAFELRDGDLVIAASDGLQSLEDNRIASILRGMSSASSAEIAKGLLDAIAELDDPEQDNTSIAVVQVSQANATDLVADAVRSAVCFAEGFDGDRELPTMEEPAAVGAETAGEGGQDSEPTDPDLAAAIAAATASFLQDEAPSVTEVVEVTDDASSAEQSEADELPVPNLAFSLQNQEPDSEDVADDDSDIHVSTVDDDDASEEVVTSEAPQDAAPEDDPAEAISGTGQVDLASDVASLDESTEPTPETVELREAAEEEEGGNIFGFEASDDLDESEVSGASDDTDEPAIPLFDDDSHDEDAEPLDQSDAAMVSLRAEPRNERRPGAPILRRIVVEASR